MRVLFTLSCFLCLCSLSQVSAQQKKILRFNTNGTFKIAQFTDLHFGESWASDSLSIKVEEDLLDYERPDFVMMTGDSVTGYAWPAGDVGWFNRSWVNLTKPMVERNISWAFTFGNHDDEGELNRTQILELDMKYPLSLTQKGPSNIHGSSNYFLFVWPSDPNNKVPVAVLYILDSSDDNCENVTGWGCVYPDQIQWYKDTSRAIREKFGKVIPALAFFHIPVPEFMYMWNLNITYGRLEDMGVCCFSVNTGLYQAFVEMGDVISVHCGHDHNNDFFGTYNDSQILLAYGRKSGYGGYGPPGDWLRGSRILVLQESPFGLTHYIRQEDGSITLSKDQPPNPSNSSTLWTQCCGMDTGLGYTAPSNCRIYEDNFRSTMNLHEFYN